MTEHDEQRPLTRRELRLREMAETGALDLSEVSAAPVPAAPTADAAAPSPTDDVDISPNHPDGTPRSRREMRELREQILAERAATQESHAAAEAEQDARVAAEAAAVAEREAAAAIENEREAAEAAAREAAEAEQAERRAAETAAREAAAAADQAEREAAAAADRAEREAAAAAAQAEREAAAAAKAQAKAEAKARKKARSRPAETSPASDTVAEDTVSETAAADNTGAAVLDSELATSHGSDARATSDTTLMEALTEQASTDTAAVADEALDFDSLIAPPTEPFTVADLAEAAVAGDTIPAGDVVEEPLIEADPQPVAEATEEPEADKPKRRFPWKRDKGAAAEADPGDVSAEAAVAEETLEEFAAVTAVEASVLPADSPEPPTVVGEIVSEAAAVTEPEASTTSEAPEVIEVESIPAPVSAVPTEKTDYSFPDIAPPEEWRSVFDNPESRSFPEQGTSGNGDFDDLISRAVAQEGSTSTGTSALILPTMPDDTGGLTGPLGHTGDLYVTGSLHLPKSLGETGGHSSLHESLEFDPITGGVSDEPAAQQDGPAPVSARHAVSARVAASGLPVVAKPTRERSRKPLVLALTGGGLLVVVVGIGVFVATSGMLG